MEQTKILVVEDDREINSMLCEMLDENGYAAEGAFTGIGVVQTEKRRL